MRGNEITVHNVGVGRVIGQPAQRLYPRYDLTQVGIVD